MEDDVADGGGTFVVGAADFFSNVDEISPLTFDFTGCSGASDETGALRGTCGEEVGEKRFVCGELGAAATLPEDGDSVAALLSSPVGLRVESDGGLLGLLLLFSELSVWFVVAAEGVALLTGDGLCSNDGIGGRFEADALILSREAESSEGGLWSLGDVAKRESAAPIFGEESLSLLR